MATMQGITGKLSGKMGSAVFRVREGQQVITQYNPIVKNPNTQGQQNQRASFKLLSQLGAVMNDAIGTMGTNTSASKGTMTARNGFFKKNFPLVKVNSSNGAVAKIPMEQLQLTDSFRPLGTMTTNTINAGQIGVNISIPKSTGVKKGKVILVGYGTMSVTKSPQIVQIVDVPVVASDIGFVDIDYVFENVDPGDYTVLAYGIIPLTNAASKIDLDNIHTPGDEDFIAAVDLRTLTSEGATAETITIGKNVVVPE